MSAPLRILIVEDEPIVAMCLEDMLDVLGHVAVGPAARLCDGLALAQVEAIDAAILDINLAGERSTPIAYALRARGVPFAFASGYAAGPEGFETVPLIAKPYRLNDIEGALAAIAAAPR